MTEFPEFATYVGYPGQNDRWTDNSLAAIERRKRELDEPLAVVKAIRRERLSAPDRLNYDLFRRRLEREIEGNRFRDEDFAITQRDGVQQDVAQLVVQMPAPTVPAYRKLYDYFVGTYLPKTRESIGMSALPDGAAWYAYRVRQFTTTSLTPEQIHELGLREVKRIRAQMDSVIASTGFKGSFADFARFLRTDPQFFYDDSASLVRRYRDIAKRIDPGLVKLFGRLPRLPYGVTTIPSYMAKSQTTAYYQGGSLPAGRPGYFFVNTFDLKARPKWEMEALSLHEAVPGHHLQIALAQELEGLPEFRRYGGYTAFVEGWGLYSEGLGPELGMYQDPYSKFGQLTYEMWRAVRLVLDTGIHTMGWTRQQAIDFFKDNTPKAEQDIIVEVDRYIVNPGQALAYKIGQLKFRELRDSAAAALGPRVDIRAFHDEVLRNGGLPMDLLEHDVREWIAGRRQAAAAGGPRVNPVPPP